MEKQFLSNSSEETEELGRCIGARLNGGEALQLVGDVGAGKTTFVRGLAEGAGSKDAVPSPTFTIGQVYGGPILIRHFDFYRLHDDAMIKHEVAEDTEKNDVIVMEWAQEVSDVLDRNILVISFIQHDEQKRQITITGSDKYEYLLS